MTMHKEGFRVICIKDGRVELGRLRMVVDGLRICSLWFVVCGLWFVVCGL